MIFCLLSIAGIVSAQTTSQLAKKALAATVLLEMVDSDGKSISTGSGFFVDENTVATNYRLIQGAVQGTAKQMGRYRKITVNGVIATDKQNDMALLKVSDYGTKALPLNEDSNTMKVGDRVYVAGHSKDIESILTIGAIENIVTRVEMTAPIPPGTSGGPVLNQQGEVIGVCLLRHENGQKRNIIIPVNALRKLLTQTKSPIPLSQLKTPISADNYFQKGYEKHLQEKYVDAIKDYTMVIHLDHKQVSMAYTYRGIAKAKLEQYFAAIADYNTAIQLNSHDALAYHNRGLAKVEIGQYRKAIQDYDTSIKLKTGYVDAWINRGIAKAMIGQHAAAVADYNTAIKHSPENAKAYSQRGISKAGLEKHDMAIQDYDTALRLYSDHAITYTYRGISKAALGHHTKAIIDYNTAIKLNPDNALAYTHRGIAKATLGQYTAAIQDYDAALKTEPGNALAYYRRGVVKLIIGQTTEGQHDLTIAQKYAEKSRDATLKNIILQVLQQE